MWHLPNFSKRLELLIKPSGFGYNAYNQAVYVKIPDQAITDINEYYNVNFVDIEGNNLYYYSKKFFPGTNEVEYYVKIESVDDINYTSLFFYYDIIILGSIFYGNCSWNPFDKSYRLTLSNKNLTVTHTGNHTWGGVRATKSISSGKIYWEIEIVNDPASCCIYIGIGTSSAGLGSGFGDDANGYAYRDYDGWKNHNGSLEAYGDSYTVGDIIGIALDLNNGKIWWSKNGVWQASGNPAAGTNAAYSDIYGTFFPMQSTVCGSTVTIARFSGVDQTYSPPSGFNAGFYINDNDSAVGVFEDAYIVNYLDTTNLVSIVGSNFSNHGAALHQPICDTYAAKTIGGTSYVSCSVSKTSFTLFFNCYLLSGSGYLVYFSSTDYVYVHSDGSLAVKINGVEYSVGSKLYFDVCSTFSITCDGENTYVVINGLTKLTIKQTFGISEIRLGGNGSSGYSVECYFFDLFLLPPKLPLYSYYLHNTVYDNSNFFRESGYDNPIVNGYLTHWPEVIFSGDEVIFKSNGELISEGWRYYRPITITNSGTSYLSDYQVKLKLTTLDLGSPYNNINNNGSDIRFISASGSCLFDYWIESWDNVGDSYVWVSVSGIPLGDSVVRMYYGHTNVNSCSNGGDTFCFFDDFGGDTLNEKWITGGQGVLSITNGYVYPSSFGTGSAWHGPTMEAEFNTPTSNYIWEVRYYWDHYQSNDLGEMYLHIRDSLYVTTERLITQDLHASYPETSLYLNDSDGSLFSCYGPDFLCYNDGWHVWKGIRDGTTLTVWFDDVQKYNGVRTTIPVSSKIYIEFDRYISYPTIYMRIDYIRLRNYVLPEPTTSIGEEVILSGILIDIPLNFYGSEKLLYSVSFNNGSSWYVSNLNYDDIFTKYFGSLQEYDTVLRLSNDVETIDKHYITKVNDFNQFRINYDVDFSAGLKKGGYLDTVTGFTPALPTISGIDTVPVEYGYEGDLTELNLSYLLRPVEFVWGGMLGSGIISKSVEFCFDTVMDSWFDDVYVDFWLGELGQGYYINMFTDFVIESKNDFYENVNVDFVLSNWKYFPHHSDVICSVIGCNNKNIEVSTCSGTLMRFVSDVKVSDMLYADFNSSVFCSVSGISPYYLFDVQVISGTLASYGSDVYCSLLDMNNYSFEVKLNTIVIENFNMGVEDLIISDFCFSVDVYDKHYGVTTSGINVYMNTNTVVGNEVTNLQFNTISGSGGYSVSWCYDISSFGSLEYVEIIVRAVNTVGDINLASYFLKYGKRYYYNLYHILKHDYEKLIPMLMVAENNVDIFPGFSAESMYVRVERYKRKDLTASIFGVGLDRSDLPASINALTTNFYNGGSYKVRIECKDLSGNIMDPFEFEFTIKSDGT